MLVVMPRAATALAQPVGQDAADLLEAVLADGGAVAARAVARLDLDVTTLVAAARRVDRGPGCVGQDALDRDWWARSAEQEARRRGHGYIGTEHLLLGLLRVAPVDAALAALGSSARAVRGQVWRLLSDAMPGGEWQAAGPGRVLHEPPLASHPALSAVAAEEPVVGMSWAASRAGQVAQTATYGWADPLGHMPVVPETRFRVGSVTKIATTLLVLRLSDYGLVDLDQPAMGKLESLRLVDHDGAPSLATVRQLLTHTAGLATGSGLRHYAGPVPAAGTLFAEGIRAVRPCGQWQYSNLGFVVLGALVADLLRAPFGRCLQDWVLGPLGLAESESMQQLPSSSPPVGIPVAGGHTFDAGQVFPVRPSAVLALAAGELLASARDVAALVAATVNGQLLSEDSACQMLTPHARLGPDAWQGLGVRIERHGSMRMVGHGGTFPGFDAAAYACPETGESAALLANTNTGLLTEQLRVALLDSQESSGGKCLASALFFSCRCGYETGEQAGGEVREARGA